jgi:hypothetical protein
MLQPANPKAKECYDRAAGARQRALEARDSQERQLHLDDERRWLKLAQSYDFANRLDHFLDTAAEPKHPRCTACAVPMWLVDIHHVPGDPPQQRRFYECKVCDAKLVMNP